MDKEDGGELWTGELGLILSLMRRLGGEPGFGVSGTSDNVLSDGCRVGKLLSDGSMGVVSSHKGKSGFVLTSQGGAELWLS